MAASSSSVADWYDVFINHQGVDVKRTFARSLYLRLLERGFRAFLDPDELQSGYGFLSQRKNAIKIAPLHVAIFSPRYAESQWCLDALELMLESKALIIPVFYRVTPAEVRWTQGKDGKYAQALEGLAKKRTHEGTLRYDSTTIENWRNALSRVADNSGFFELEVCNGEELELELLDEMVKWLSKTLEKIDKMVKCMSKILKKPDLYVAEYPTGLDYMLKDFEHTVQLHASSASAASTSISNYGYDVFINHHGPDVKRTFASHLYHRLVFYGLRPFLDNEEMQEGDNMAIQIEEAIATASVHVAIFSRRYAESHGCLDELLLMLESGVPVFPVFYNVKPWTKGKDGVYGRALQNHENKTMYDSQADEEKRRYNSNKIEKWRMALDRISEISGLELEAFEGDEAELLDNVVKSVLKSVRKAPLYVVENLIGLDEKVEDFENTVLLQRQSGKPQVVGLVGLGGVGKTTLAKELINRKSSSFSRTCFLFDVRKTVARSSLHFLQSKLFKDLTNMNIQIESVTQGIELFTKHISSIGATAFVILDDVDNVHQLEALLPVQNFLPSKSLILITSRSEDVLTRYGVEQSSIYNLTDKWQYSSLAKYPTRWDRKVKDFADTVLLQQQSEELKVVGIVGLAGIGKTRLATEFFIRKSSDYRRSYFLYDVTENARTSCSLYTLQSKLLRGLTQLDLQVEGEDEGMDLFKKHVSYFQSLVILDNVDHWDQLHALLSVLSVLPSGSLILITSRDRDVLNLSGVQESSIYELTGLNTEDSLELFCTHAFGQPSPRLGFEDLVDKFLRHCNGLPLTLKVFGALLWGKTNRSYWKEQLDKFHQYYEIEKRFKLSYDELNEEEQQIFLHIACSCIGQKRDLAVRLWDGSGFKGLFWFERLQKRCLVEVDSEDCIIMHEHLRDLGRTIADEKGLRRTL